MAAVSRVGEESAAAEEEAAQGRGFAHCGGDAMEVVAEGFRDLRVLVVYHMIRRRSDFQCLWSFYIFF